MAKIFFSGIGGSGMSALAGFSVDKGYIVAGSDRFFDRNPDNHICRILKQKGVKIVPQDGTGIDNSFDFVVFSTAVEDNHPEFIKAKQSGITLKTRPQYLNEIVSEYKTLAVAGTSGKSTAAGMLAFVMRRLGMEPNYIGGGRVKQFKTPENPGNFLTGESDLLIVEACESDSSIINYWPFYSIISNLSLDHHPVEKTAGMFETLSNNTKEMVIINSDDENLSRCNFKKAIGFSIDRDSDYRAEENEYNTFETAFKVRGINFRLSLPGKHNLYNALSCIAMLSELGIKLEDIAIALPEFSGIDRRFDVYLNNGRNLVIDDYAHNPHKIENLMETMKKIRRNICYIFQPHGFGPTRLMKHGYIEVFIRHLRKEDHLFLLPIYYAGGTSLKDISSKDLCREIKAAGRSVEVLSERSLLFGKLNSWNAYVIFGARDESLADFAGEIAFRLK